MRLKDGVKFKKLTHETLVALAAAEAIYKKYDAELWVTSANDSEHMRGSKHYDGNAVDIRTRNLKREDRGKVTNEIADTIGDDYDVILYDTHIHIEYDPE